MSSVLFDVPGPRARRRHLGFTGITAALLLLLAYLVVRKLMAEEVLTTEVANGVYQNRYLKFMLDGLVATLIAAAMAIVTSLIFGALFAAGRLSDHKIVQLPCAAVIEFFRAVPLVLMIIIFFYSFRDLLGARGALVTALTLYNGSVLAEVFRAGVNAVPRGQSEAAYGIGLRKTQVMIQILMPQAVRFMLPAIISQCVVILKDTSLGAIIVYEELVRNTRQVALVVPDGTVLAYATAAVVFITINYALSRLAVYLEQRVASRGEKGIDPLALDSTMG